MKITSLDKENNKYRVYVDEEYVFCLFYKELTRYNIELDCEITMDCIETIRSEIIVKRGIQYIYHLLAKRAYTYYELEQKMKKAGYVDLLIEHILDKFLKKGFINDLDYSKRYIENMQKEKSSAQITYTLKNKGIDISTIQTAIEELGLGEVEAAKKVMLKRVKGNHELTPLEKGKLYKYMLNKGFKMETIKLASSLLDKNNGE